MSSPIRRRGRVLVLLAVFVLLCVSRPLQAMQETPAEQNETGKVQPVAFNSDMPFDIDADPDRPFGKRIDAPDFPRGAVWLNTGGPLQKRDLAGKFVLIDFWTYCCINCMHIIPTLDKLEKKYSEELVVIGVHSAKFDNEKDDAAILKAILRYEIHHPVINDSTHRVWDSFGARSWPTLLLMDPQGKIIWAHQGEIRFDKLDAQLTEFIKYYDALKLIDRTPLHIELAEFQQQETPLRFPGKVLADAASNRLFISDSNHNRIVVTSLAGKLLDVIGSGQAGNADGPCETATFDHQQGLALHDETLFVADTENHLIRAVDLRKRSVRTIAGIGSQAKTAFPGYDRLESGQAFPARWVGKPLETAIASPWDLEVHNSDLFIAMAGPHQIWKMPLSGKEIGPYAGNGREDIVDGDLLPRQPYAKGYASFAQPSGLASDGESLFVADSEGSSIRAVPFDPKQEVRTVIGTAHLPYNRLFSFGDVDGGPTKAKLQHALGVEWLDDKLYVADTYNNKIKRVDAESGRVETIAGTGAPGNSDEPASFDEPAGVSLAGRQLFVADTNNHAIRVLNLETLSVSTLNIEGLAPPTKPKRVARPSFEGAKRVTLNGVAVQKVDDKIKVDLDFRFARGWKLNTMTEVKVFVEPAANGVVIDRERLQDSYPVSAGEQEIGFSVPIKGAGKELIKVSAIFYYCRRGGEGLCKVGKVVWTVPLTVNSAATEDTLRLRTNVLERAHNQFRFDGR